MMTAAECTVLAESAMTNAAANPEGPLRRQWEESARQWLALAVAARAQVVLREKLLGR
jgi:hypothetical protein